MSTPPPDAGSSLAAVIGLYTLARIGLVAAVAGALVLAGVPLLIAVLVGLIVALPLSMVLFRGLRGRMDRSLAQVRDRRSAERAALRSRLRGEPAPAPSDERTSDDQAQPESDRGER
jgi:hypothetical protein